MALIKLWIVYILYRIIVWQYEGRFNEWLLWSYHDQKTKSKPTPAPYLQKQQPTQIMLKTHNLKVWRYDFPTILHTVANTAHGILYLKSKLLGQIKIGLSNHELKPFMMPCVWHLSEHHRWGSQMWKKSLRVRRDALCHQVLPARQEEKQYHFFFL